MIINPLNWRQYFISPESDMSQSKKGGFHKIHPFFENYLKKTVLKQSLVLHNFLVDEVISGLNA